MTLSESVICCEGFHDRAFWKGMLLHLGCTDPGAPTAGGSGRRSVYDPWGSKVFGGGQFAYLSRSGEFIRVVPCGGNDGVLTETRLRLQLRTTKAVREIVVCLDSDKNADGSPPASRIITNTAVEAIARGADRACTAVGQNGFAVDGGATRVHLVTWSVADPPSPTLPNQQTLERLVTAAIIAAYPTRALPVQNWLATRPAPPPPSPKDFAWSHMAGWYSEHGCDAFLSETWKDRSIAAELEGRLGQNGAWSVAQALTA